MAAVEHTPTPLAQQRRSTCLKQLLKLHGRRPLPILQLNNGLKAGQKISKTVQQQVKEVINADARVVRQIARSTDKAISHGEKTVVIGVGENINKIANAITAPLVGGGPAHAPHHSAAAREALKTIKAVEHGKQKVCAAAAAVSPLISWQQTRGLSCTQCCHNSHTGCV